MAGVSKRIQVLERARLVLKRKEGRIQHCRLNPKPLDAVARLHEEFIPGNRLVFTWNGPYAKDSVATVQFRKSQGGTELILTHEFLADVFQIVRITAAGYEFGP